MALAWKVMLPLGLVNLVLVAVIVELRQVYGQDGRLEASTELGIVLITWVASILAYVGWTIFVPLHTDNRPRLASNV
jgi:hypothetical protein